MGRFAFYQIICNVQNWLIANRGRFAFYQIIYNARIAMSLVSMISVDLPSKKYYTMFKIALSLVSLIWEDLPSIK